MSSVQVPVVYFDRPGPENTEDTLALAKARADALGLRHVLVATTSGATGRRAGEILRGRHVVAVTHSAGFARPNEQELLDEHRAAMQALGVDILTCQHALGGVNRAVRRKLATYELDEIIAYTLRVLGQGTKVCCEIAMMAADAGRVPTGDPVLAVAGSGSGADTAVVLIPANAQSFFDLVVQEYVCKPAFRA
ncbi:MAG TPA: pyruvate kinase alpha/beta domain-containing protein [Anaerolineae bacterium]|nr:pyruvate kinase alpha/beta domain-containing protein [Anaerolineae bacterium]HOR01036.1 pyruvate kinase alpha/beta domain-containing protein [Anaerolineae bacterium]HPL30669.1 pyruvate kinase alpha/beta domain-containing protein [Anaerolineae bacterium]